MRLSLLLSVSLLLPSWQTACAQSADDFFNSGAHSYISNNIPQALESVETGLKQYPDDVKLKKLYELLKQQSQQQSQNNQSQQNQNQQSQQNQSQPQKSHSQQNQPPPHRIRSHKIKTNRTSPAKKTAGSKINRHRRRRAGNKVGKSRRIRTNRASHCRPDK